MVNRAETLRVLLEGGIHLTKRFGQHFLVDGNILRRILSEAEAATGGLAGRHVLEIGPGIGTLTEALLAAGAMVSAVEIDERFQRLLGVRFARHISADDDDSAPGDPRTPANMRDPRLRVIPADAMRLDSEELTWPGQGAPTALIANLPYAVATPLILDHLRDSPELTVMVVMVQDEAAARLIATPGSKIYGSVTARLSTVATARKLFPVSAGSFLPPPNVASAVVLVERRPDAPSGSRLVSLWSLIDAAFASRRKTIRNTLSAAMARASSGDAGYGFNHPWMAGVPRLEESFDVAGVQGSQRAEELGADTFIRLHDALVDAALRLDSGIDPG